MSWLVSFNVPQDALHLSFVQEEASFADFVLTGCLDLRREKL